MYKNNKIDRKYELSKYSISDKNEAIFTVFTSFDENSSVFRKNPHGAVNAFQSAFENKTNVRLIIKLTGTRFSKKIPNIWLNDPRIHIVSSNLNENDIISLMKSCDCVISLHRAEGYGLLIAKALANGLPVISTNYSGPEDFIDCPNAYAVDYELVPIIDPTGIYKSKHGHWADPNIIKAAEHLKYIESLRINEREKKSSAAILWWKKNHTEKDFIAKIPKKHMKKIN
jgi:glycosyltransferase involved in cell wall biosynthesis